MQVAFILISFLKGDRFGNWKLFIFRKWRKFFIYFSNLIFHLCKVEVDFCFIERVVKARNHQRSLTFHPHQIVPSN